MDTRLKTYLTLCNTMNYRRTAEEVNLTQPAVTKQIQSLEEEYGTKLFQYVGRRLYITEDGLLLKQFAESQHYNEAELFSKLRRTERRVLRLGATKSIGDSVLDGYLARYLETEHNNLSLVVANTSRLLSMLDASELDFIVVEGSFEKKKYEVRLLRQERFIGICALRHPFAGTIIPVQSLSGQNLFLREEGSGTRDIFERELKSRGYDLSIFNRTTILSSFQPLKKLVSLGLGISFVYQPVADTDQNLAQFMVADMALEHEFNIVWLKHTSAYDYVNGFFRE